MNTDMELTYEDIEQPPEDETPPPDAPAGAAIAPVIDTTAIAPQVVDPETLPDLEAAEPGISLNPKYREFNDEGETVRAVFCGFDHAEPEPGETNPGRYLPDANGGFCQRRREPGAAGQEPETADAGTDHLHRQGED